MSVKVDNYSLVDAMWGFSLPIITALYVWLGSGWMPRKWLALALAVGWGLRLGGYLLKRVLKHHPEEEVRYVELRKEWKAGLKWKFLKFFQMQALAMAAMSLPLLLVCMNPRSEWSWIEIGGAAVWLIGVGGEALADAQMARFKANKDNKGKVCQEGLWRWSRHPNYFFEWVIWVGFWLFACGSPWGWTTVFAPALILYLLLRVTGIPFTERCSVASKGDAYRRYQQTTSAFVPWPPKGA